MNIESLSSIFLQFVLSVFYNFKKIFMNVELTSARLGMLILCVYLINNRMPACVVKHCSNCFSKAVGE